MMERVKNLATTIIGLFIIGIALYLWIVGTIDTTALIIAIPFGWTFITAKNTLLNGVSGGLIKVKQCDATNPTA